MDPMRTVSSFIASLYEVSTRVRTCLRRHLWGDHLTTTLGAFP
jgi:hypothetical protein